MADGIGVRVRLDPADDYLHPLEAAENFNESMYFNVFDREHRTDEREYVVTGKVMSLIPLRNRRRTPDGEELMTRITEGMTEYRCDDEIGYGLSEYLDQIVDGEPVGLKAGM
jgi:hypothetical protein